MNEQSIPVLLLKEALESRNAELCALEAQVGDLRRAILRLGGSLEVVHAPSATFDAEAVAALVSRMESSVEDDEKFPVSSFRGMSRVAVAVSLARTFDGFLTTAAYRKVLSKPGVLRSAKQAGSVASRILMKSEEFLRIADGFYWLKDYSKEAQVQQQTPP